MVRWRGVGQDGGLQGARWKVEENFREFWAGAPERLSADGSGHILEPEHVTGKPRCRFYTEFRLSCICQGCVMVSITGNGT